MSECPYCYPPISSDAICDRHRLLLANIDQLLFRGSEFQVVFNRDLSARLLDAHCKGLSYAFDTSGSHPTTDTGLSVGNFIDAYERDTPVGGTNQILKYWKVKDINNKMWYGKAKNPGLVNFRPTLKV